MSAASVEVTVPTRGSLSGGGTAMGGAVGAPAAHRHATRFGTAALPLLLVLGLVALAPSSAAAQGDDDPAALALLRRAVVAASAATYRGVQIDTTWTASGMTTRMINVQQTAGLRSLSVRAPVGGAPSTTVSPVRGVGVLVDPLALIAAAYAVSYAGRDEVAGRWASLVVALRDGRVAARLWFDDDCGLLLRQEVWDSQGRLTRVTSLVELEEPVIGPVTQVAGSRGSGTAGGSRDGVNPLGPAAGGAGSASDNLAGPTSKGRSGSCADGVPWEGPQLEAARLRSFCPTDLPGGFRLVDTRVTAVGGDGGPTSSALHLTYSDGLSAISVFVQVGRLPEAGLPGMAAEEWGSTQVYLAAGWPVRAVWQGDGHVFTVVSDAPVAEVSAAARVLPGIRSAPGMIRRVVDYVRVAEVLLPGR